MPASERVDAPRSAPPSLGAGGRVATAVVTDLEGRGALAAGRTLARAGYRVVGTATSRLAPGAWSRACSRRVLLPDPREDARAYVDALAAALAAEGADVLVPGSDAALLAISAGRGALPPGVRTGLPDHDVVLRATDKVAVGAEAEAVGIGPPETVDCADVSAAREAAGRLGYPVVLKPPRSVAVDGRMLRERRSRRAEGDDDLAGAFAELGPPLLVQEALPGAVHSIAGVVVDGTLRGAVAARYRRTWPAEAGAAAFAETIAADGDLLRRVEALVVSLGWNGIFEVELVPRSDGSYAVIDFNPRIYGSLALSAAAGAPLVTIWCDALLGREDGFKVAAPGIAYRCEDFDARHLLSDLGRRRPRAALEVLRPHRRVVHAYADLRDPVPVVVRWTAGIARRLRTP